MSFTRETIKDFYLLTTDVENIFINEYMPAAPGDFVKVYLYGLLYSQNGGEMSFETMGRQLGLSAERISEAWDYWQRMGVVEKTLSKGGKSYDIKFKQLRAMMYAVPQEDSRGVEPDSAEDDPLCNKELKATLEAVEQIKGKPLSPLEIREIFSLIEDDKASSEVVNAAFEYCIEKGKTGINYIAKVAREWTKEGLKTKEDVEKRLQNTEERQSTYKAILQTLGLSRGATEAERKMVDSWLDEMKFNMEKIMEACTKASFISSPNLRYVNKVLQNWYEEAKISGRNVNSKNAVTQATLNRYYEYLRNKAEEDAAVRRKKIYKELPRIEELDREVLTLGQDISKAVLSGGAEKINDIKRLIHLLEEERSVILAENNYQPDYTDIKYICDKCNDTGITEDGNRCSCVKERMGEAEVWQNSTSQSSN